MTRTDVLRRAKAEAKKLNKPVWIWTTYSGQETWSSTRHSRWVTMVFPDETTLNRDFDQEPWALSPGEEEDQQMWAALERRHDNYERAY